MAEQNASPLPAGLSWLHAPVGARGAMVVSAAALAGLSLLLGRPAIQGPPVAPHIFEYLFHRNEPAAAWLALAILVAATIAARSGRFPERLLVSRLTASPKEFVAAVTVVLAAAALLVYRAHPLSMDEYAPLFQARVFARGHLAAQVPPELVPRLVPPIRWFLESSPSGAMLSAYWPGFALLLTPFVWLGCPWLLNPLLGGAVLLLVWRLARRLWPQTDAPGWAVLFTAASPAFSVNAISYYSMNAHLAASLCFATLVLERRLFLAGAVGSLAFALHNPFPHLLFAIPFIAWLAWQPGRIRAGLRLAAGYAPGLIVLVGGWMWCRARFTAPVETQGGLLAGLEVVRRYAFTAPSLDLLVARTMSLAELASWAVPLLLPLAVFGAVRCRANTGARLVALAALLTGLGYLFVPYDQGHGWGYRYFHSAWGALPLLAAGALESTSLAAPVRKLAVGAALLSLVLCTSLRFAQVRSFMDAHLSQLPPAAAERGREVIFVDPRRGSYSVDLVQNDPFLDNDRWILLSHGDAQDARFMHAFFPRSRRTLSGPVASLWVVR
ncbi:MAG TPA: hypothetical protein VFA79_10190 [Myxococcales bacterium]|nr:hypothetical protein [Myxococcales bacterium]